MRLPELPLVRYSLRFEALEPMRLPEYPADMWYRALKSALDVFGRRDPRLGGDGTVWGYLFESQRPGGGNAPGPLIVRSAGRGPRTVAAGEELACEIVLVGHANAFWQDLIDAAAVAAIKGLGFDADRGRARLTAVDTLPLGTGVTRHIANGNGPVAAPLPATPIPPEAPERIRVELVTPLRLRRQPEHSRKGHVVLGREKVDGAEIAAEAINRIDRLARHHAPTPWDVRFQPLVDAARKVTTVGASLEDNKVRRPGTGGWDDRYVPGVLGTLVLELGAGGDLWRLLWLAQWVSLGHGVAWGLGQLRVGPA